MKVPGILKNMYVCYALMALAALNVIGYLTVKAWECLALFALTAYSVHSYCGDKSLAILADFLISPFFKFDLVNRCRPNVDQKVAN